MSDFVEIESPTYPYYPNYFNKNLIEQAYIEQKEHTHIDTKAEEIKNTTTYVLHIQFIENEYHRGFLTKKEAEAALQKIIGD